MNSFQMNSVHLTEAGSGTVERCRDSRGQMHVRNQVGKLRIDSETGATEMEVSPVSAMPSTWMWRPAT